MLKKIREKRYIEKNVKKTLPVLFAEIEQIRKKSNSIAICPTPTGANWQGVMNATFSLFPENTFTIPQYFSNSVYTENELKEISYKINELNFEKIVFSGFPGYFSFMAGNIKSAKISAIFHGALSELTNENNQLRFILNLAASGKIHRIGFIKKGLSEYFNNTSSAKCFDLPLKTKLPENIEKSILENGINIGVFGNTTFNKNIHNQVAAALLIKESKVYVICDLDFSYLDKNNRIIKHGKTERKEFLGLMAAMTINSHISFSESWGQIVTESLALGVPCLTSDNNGIFDYDDYLAEKLIVNQYDNPIAIAKQIESVLKERKEISEKGIEYIKQLNIISKENLKVFLAD